MKSNLWTIVSKEFARFFGDRQLLLTTVLLPGVLIYIVYSLMGVGMRKMATEGVDEYVTLTIQNLPASIAPLIPTGDEQAIGLIEAAFDQAAIGSLEDKEINTVLMRFPEGFDSLVAAYTPASATPAPNVEIYYNSGNNASARVYSMLTTMLTAYEDGMANKFDVNRVDAEEQRYDQADINDVLGDIWSKILPMLIVMMIFSGVMSTATTAIAGEKERGTIATLLVTPMRRNELALGKIISISVIALLSGLSSFVGIALSLPKMVGAKDVDVDLGFNYTLPDYAALLLVILATVLIMAAAVSLLSAWSKDTKNAGTLVTPLSIVLMLIGLLPMFLGDAPTSPLPYLIPFYNSIEVMTAIFAHKLLWANALLTLVSNIIYTAIAIWGLTRMFNSEKIMFNR